MTVLAFQEDAGSRCGIVHCQHDHRAGVMDQIAADLYASGFLDVVGGDPEDWTAINRREETRRAFDAGDDLAMTSI